MCIRDSYKEGDACLLNRNTRHIDIKGRNSIAVFLNLSTDYVAELMRDSSETSPKHKIHLFLSSNLKGNERFARNYLTFTPTLQSYGDDTLTVSYTHLDVYKGQVLFFLRKILFDWRIFRLVYIFSDVVHAAVKRGSPDTELSRERKSE